MTAKFDWLEGRGSSTAETMRPLCSAQLRANASAEYIPLAHQLGEGSAPGHGFHEGGRTALASLMGMALHFDTHPSTRDDKPLREAGIDPRPATAYIKESVGAAT